jgi:hypothetical protein
MRILIQYKLEGTIKDIIKKTKFNVLLAYYVQTYLIVTKLHFEIQLFSKLL